LDKNIAIETNLNNRKFLIDKIYPLLIKIRKEYRTDNEVFETVKTSINSLGNGSPNKAYASSLINKVVKEYNKKIFILNKYKPSDSGSNLQLSKIKSTIEELNEIEDDLSSCPEISEKELNDIINRLSVMVQT
jgi:hypothetical protein